jgi:hypothetical protein
MIKLLRNVHYVLLSDCLKIAYDFLNFNCPNERERERQAERDFFQLTVPPVSKVN